MTTMWPTEQFEPRNNAGETSRLLVADLFLAWKTPAKPRWQDWLSEVKSAQAWERTWGFDFCVTQIEILGVSRGKSSKNGPKRIDGLFKIKIL